MRPLLLAVVVASFAAPVLAQNGADGLDPNRPKMLDRTRLRIVDRLRVTPPPMVALATPFEGPPVITLAEDGAFSSLRVGTAMVEVSFAGATSQFPIKVKPYEGSSWNNRHIPLSRHPRA